VAVAAGEAISERHALEALLLPSADNMAWILARWDAGSQAAFTAKMNDTARRLGMTGTSYNRRLRPGLLHHQLRGRSGAPRHGGDASARGGRDRRHAHGRRSRGRRNPQHHTLLGQDGIAGLKTGSTQAAGGCILIAAWQQESGRQEP